MHTFFLAPTFKIARGVAMEDLRMLNADFRRARVISHTYDAESLLGYRGNDCIVIEVICNRFWNPPSYTRAKILVREICERNSIPISIVIVK